MISLHNFAKWALPGILFIPSSCDQKVREDTIPVKPNIILFIADDMNWDDAGAYGNPHIRTPNLDRMAANGIKFTNAFLTISSCSPSRASIITGMYPHQTDAEQLHWTIPADKITFVEKLRDAGYWTAQAGKWHMGNAIMDRFDFLASEKAFMDASKDREIPDLLSDDNSGAHLWISTLQHRPDDRPFFLWFAAIDPHRPYEENIISPPHDPDDVIIPPYMPDTPDVRKDFALYYDEVTRMDDYIGQVMDELEKQGVLDNTVVLFISDNGRPFPRDKTTMYDGGIKTPFILQWPEVVKPGTVSSSLVSAVDIAPTFLRLAGIEPGDNFIGEDFSPILTVPEKEIRDNIFAQAHWHDHERMYRAVRDKKYKYIRNFYPDLPNTPPADALKSYTFAEMLRLKEASKLNQAQMNVFISPTPEEELYDTENDPFELDNLATDPEYGGILEKMQKVMKAFMDETNDQIPETRTPDEFHRITGDPLPNRQWPRPGKFEDEPVEAEEDPIFD
ncbi:MAG: sulfatase [Bacteroidales bacterium]